MCICIYTLWSVYADQNGMSIIPQSLLTSGLSFLPTRLVVDNILTLQHTAKLSFDNESCRTSPTSLSQSLFNESCRILQDSLSKDQSLFNESCRNDRPWQQDNETRCWQPQTRCWQLVVKSTTNWVQLVVKKYNKLSTTRCQKYNVLTTRGQKYIHIYSNWLSKDL